MKANKAAAITMGGTLLGALLIYGSATATSAREPDEIQATSPATLPAASQPTQPATADAAIVVPQTNGPITYYVLNCSRCHGDISAAYTGLAHPKRGKELRQIIEDMATGPANAPIDAAALDEQVRLHEAMFDRKPYAWIDPVVKDMVAGEKLENTTVEVQQGEKITAAKEDEYRFSAIGKKSELIVRSK